MKLAFIGIGNVGFALANVFAAKGHQIVIAHDNPKADSVVRAQSLNPAFATAPIQQAVDQAEIVVLATPFQANEQILRGIRFSGQVLIDCTNPVGRGISHGLNSERSGSELVQQWAPQARVVKAYTIYGFENFADADFGQTVRPAMLICGQDAAAKAAVSQLNQDLGYDTVDTGGLDQALHLEHMTLLWVKMVRRDGHHPRFVWAYLEK